MADDTPAPDPDTTADAAVYMQEEGVISEIPPAKETPASLLTKRSSTKKINSSDETQTEPHHESFAQSMRVSFAQSSKSTRRVLNRFDLEGDGIISPSGASLMASAIVLEEKEKKKYKSFLRITFVLLVLTLVANFGLTIATIYLTRQFDIEDGILVDKSTGKQLTTKTHGNLIDATLFGEVDDAGRLLHEQNNMCFATTSMNDDKRDAVMANYLAGESVRYIAKVNDIVVNGVVKFMDAPQPMYGSAVFDMEGFGHYKGMVDEEFGVDVDTCTLYHEVVCAECAASGSQSEFFMWCCGTTDQAMFRTGNCCIVSYAQLGGWDARRLGKCIE